MTDISSQNIAKIVHPIKEIRQRALYNLFSKLEFGFKFDNELNRRKELLEVLLQWFRYNDIDFQDKVLKMILSILKSESGDVLIKHISSDLILKDLNTIKPRVDAKFEKYFQDIVNYLETKNISLEEHCLNIPDLEIPQSAESEFIARDLSSSNDNLSGNSFQSNNRTFRDDRHSSKPWMQSDGNDSSDLLSQGIKIYLMPWCQLCETDLNTIIMIEDAICSTQALERTTYFFIDILLKDFPPELFLNRPKIVQCLYKMLNSLDTSTLAMEALCELCSMLNKRIHQFYDLDLRHYKKFIFQDTNHLSGVASHSSGILEHLFASETDVRKPTIDCGDALSQIPLPLFCLETIYCVLICLGRGVSPLEQNDTLFSMKEMNIALSLCFEASSILSKILTMSIWENHQSNKFSQQVAQKIIIVLRTLGDVLNRYRVSFTICDMTDSSYRITYLRLLAFATQLAKLFNNPTVYPSTFSSGLCNSLSDVSCLLLYPKLHADLKNLIMFSESGILQDQKNVAMYNDTDNICNALKIAVNLMQNVDNLSQSSKIIKIIRESLPALEFHKSHNIFNIIINTFCRKMPKWKLNSDNLDDIRFITLFLLAHHSLWVKETFYSAIHDVVIQLLGGVIHTKDSTVFRDEASLNFLLHPSILTEIISQGLESESEKVLHLAKDIIEHLLKGKLLMSDKGWDNLLEAMIPTLPYLHIHAAYDDDFGQSIIKTLDLKIGQCMLIPQLEMIMGNIRLLFTKCYTAQMEGSLNLTKLLNLQEGSDNLLPKHDNIRPDILCSMIRNIIPNNFNVIKYGDPAFYERGSLLQVMSLLKCNKSLSANEEQLSVTGESVNTPDVDPSFRRSALAQLAVMMQQPSLHETFLSNNGRNIIATYLRASLTTFEYTCFPESAMSCVSILNSLCYNNSAVRQWVSENQEIILNILRTLYLFPNEESFCVTVSQLLCLLSFSQVMINMCNVNDTNDTDLSDVSLPHCIVKRTNLPFKCSTYARCSPHMKQAKMNLLNDSSISNYLRVFWCTEWFGGVEKVARWPYVPELSTTQLEDFCSSLMITDVDLTILKASCPVQGCVSALYQIQNATSHKAVNKALDTLNGYLLLTCDSEHGMSGVDSLPWCNTFSRFLISTPASPKDSSLLLNVVKCLSTFLMSLIKNDCKDASSISWILKYVMNTFRGVSSLLKPSDSDSNWIDSLDQSPNNLRHNIIHLISSCCMFCQRNCYSDILLESRPENETDFVISWGNLIEHFTLCLADADVYDYYSLAYISQMVRCLTQLTYLPTQDSHTESQAALVKQISHILCVSHVGTDYKGYKGFALVQNCFIILCHLLEDSLGDKSKMEFWLQNSLNGPKDENVLTACLLWYTSQHVMTRSLSLKLLCGLTTQPAIVTCLREKFEDSDENLMEVVLSKVIDLNEASLFRECAAILLSNILLSKNVRSNGSHLLNSTFFNKISSTITNVCVNEFEDIQAGENIPLHILKSRDILEVAHSKNVLTLPIKEVILRAPKCSVRLLSALTDVIFNILLHSDDIPDDMEESGIFRILFRCIALKLSNVDAKFVMIAAVCRTLHKAISMSPSVEVMLVNTEDCVSSLLHLFSVEYRDAALDKSNKSLQEMWKWAFLFIGSLSQTRNGFYCIWRLLSDSGLLSVFQILLLSLSDPEYKGVCTSAIFCLVKILNGNLQFIEDNKLVNIKSILDETHTISVCKKKFSLASEGSEHITSILRKSNKNDVPIFKRHECILNVPLSNDSVLGKDLCYALLCLYKGFNIGKNFNSGNIKDDECHSVISGLCTLFATSGEARLYAANNGFIQDQVDLLQEMQYVIVTDIKPLDVIQRKGGHPLMTCLNGIMQLLCNIMTNCPVAKEMFASSNVVVPLNKIWPWCISTTEMRRNTISMFCVYTNNCAKANQSMHNTVGVRSILIEIIDLVGREMSQVTRKHSLNTLHGCLRILENVSSHIHCRAIILKSEIFSHLNKLHPAVTKRQLQWKEVEVMWESFMSAMTRYPEGQLKAAEYMGVLCALVHQADGLMLTVLRNCTFNPLNRPRLLGSAEFLNMFSKILTMETSLSDKLLVCGALWALGANHQKSKLSLRTAGLTSKLTDFLHRLKYTSNGNAETERAIQIATYVSKVITIT